jgi:hypothetical protein
MSIKVYEWEEDEVGCMLRELRILRFFGVKVSFSNTGEGFVPTELFSHSRESVFRYNRAVLLICCLVGLDACPSFIISNL